MANEESKQKLLKLAEKVQSRPINTTENSKLRTALEAKKPATGEAVKEVIAESLGKSCFCTSALVVFETAVAA